MLTRCHNRFKLRLVFLMGKAHSNYMEWKNDYGRVEHPRVAERVISKAYKHVCAAKKHKTLSRTWYHESDLICIVYNLIYVA